MRVACPKHDNDNLNFLKLTLKKKLWLSQKVFVFILNDDLCETRCYQYKTTRAATVHTLENFVVVSEHDYHM